MPSIPSPQLHRVQVLKTLAIIAVFILLSYCYGQIRLTMQRLQTIDEGVARLHAHQQATAKIVSAMDHRLASTNATLSQSITTDNERTASLSASSVAAGENKLNDLRTSSLVLFTRTAELQSEVDDLKHNLNEVQTAANAAANTSQMMRATVNQLVSHQSAMVIDQQLSTAQSSDLATKDLLPTAPVYNAIFSSPVENGVIQLLTGVQSSLRFYIGSQSLLNALEAPGKHVNPLLLRSQANHDLEVTFLCKICISGDHQSKLITLTDDLYSSEATFTFTPDYTSYKALGALPAATILVQSEGVVYDQIPLDMEVNLQPSETIVNTMLPLVNPANHPTDTSAAPPTIVLQSSEIHSVPDPSTHSSSLDVYSPRREESRPASVIITLFEGPQGELYIQIVPTDKDLAKKLAGVYKTGDTINWWQIPHLWRQQLDVDLGLVVLLTRTKSAAEPIQDVQTQCPKIANASLPGSSYEWLTKALLCQGQYFYEGLFAAPETQAIIKVVEEKAVEDRANEFKEVRSKPSQPLRILIQTTGLVYPWQVLHSPDDISVGGFWGFRYDIIVNPLKETYLGAGLDRTVIPEAKSAAVFGRYYAGETQNNTEPTPAQLIAAHAQEQATYFAQSIHVKDFDSPYTRVTFMEDFRKYASSLDYLLVYAHGSDGWTVTDDGHLVEDRKGARFELGTDESVTILDLNTQLRDYQYHYHSKYSVKPLLERRPVVLLSACDTGTLTATSSGAHESFPEEFLELGASGVIATEAPVSSAFALDFGKRLIDKMAQGKPMSLGLRDVREDVMNQTGNPLGLFYTYYGGVTVAVEVPKPGQVPQVSASH